jgi:hypothetical protein
LGIYIRRGPYIFSFCLLGIHHVPLANFYKKSPIFSDFGQKVRKECKKEDFYTLTRFRRTSDGDVIPGPEQGFDIVGGYFSADLKSFLSHSLNMHFPITQFSMAFLKIKVMLLS